MTDDKDIVDESSEESFPASDPPSFTARARSGDGGGNADPCDDAELLRAMLAEDLEVEQMCAVLFMQHADRAARLGNREAHDTLQRVAGQSREIAKELGRLVASAT